MNVLADEFLDLCVEPNRNRVQGRATPTHGNFSSSEHGREFNDHAKARMIYGCAQLMPLIQEFEAFLDGHGLEVGPFKNPLLDPRMYPLKSLNFVDGDLGAIRYLRERFTSHRKVKTIHVNLNDPFLMVRDRLPKNQNVIIASQVLNYVSLNDFSRHLTNSAAPRCLLFLNNVIDYGIPDLFAQGRPEKDGEIEAAFQSLGWKILRRRSLPPDFSEQPNPRLLLVLQRLVLEGKS